jgi:hypothetical protein
MVAGRVFALLAVPALAAPYQADLVPASHRIEARDIEGSISITGADGLVRVRIESVNDANGDALDSDRCSVRLRLRVNGMTRRITIPLTVDGGDGDATQSLGLTEDDQVVVTDVRVRGPNRRTLAQAGVVTAAASAPTPPEPPPSPSECPGVLEECQGDLADCQSALDDCENADAR